MPEGLTEVIVRASDNVHKAGKVIFTIKLPPRRYPNRHRKPPARKKGRSRRGAAL